MRRITVANPIKVGRRKSQKRQSRRNQNHLMPPARDQRVTVGRVVEGAHPSQIERIKVLYAV